MAAASAEGGSAAERGVALVTGCSSGLGKACVEKLSTAGFRVFAGVRNAAAVQEAISEGKISWSSSVTVVPLDVSREDQVVDAFKTVMDTAGRLDVLVNNAGSLVVGTAEMVSMTQAQQMFDTNFFGAMRCMHAALPIMRAQKSGCIVNVSSILAEIPTMNQPVYAASKAALDALTLGTRGAVEEFGVRVHSLQPGGISDTAIGTNLTEGDRFPKDSNPYPIDALVKESVFDKIIPQAQTSSDVADVVRKIASGEITEPLVQTSEFTKTLAGEKLKDISGKHPVQLRY
eukprot:TRINITY_DN3834_c0_g2_i1.p1 TRINITY_DN3834_c0_g2~~TRINITY_DN3834_c0_g2_i1.p1  ORF type:complete len:288 (+),score=65.81 TRINITY_DN3834_c0_g2_i1:68-931(+)